MAEAYRVGSAVGRGFRLGTKDVFLPNFSIALHRTDNRPPTTAKFTVPLWFSKLDLRDYLYNAYSLPVLRITSYVQQSRIIQGKNTTSPRPQYKRWHRPRATKVMTVEMERPFVWPEEDADGYKAWNLAESKMAVQEQREMEETIGSTKDANEVGKERRESMREQARRLLEGKEKWRSGVGKGR